MGDNLTLKWNEHSISILSAAANLFSTSGLTDVVIGTADRTFRAHRLVLSICSTSFAGLFDSSGALSGQLHPYIYMQDIPSKHIDILLRYMYNGEVSIEERDLVQLLATAKSLGIKGLCEVNEPNTPVKKKQKKNSSVHEYPVSSSVHEYPVSVKEVEPEEMIEVEPNLETNSLVELYDDEGLNEEEEGGDICPEDWYGPDGLAEDGMDGVAGLGGLACPYCPKTFASNWHLKRHVLTHTKENRFKCDVCGKDFSRNDNLKSHLKSIHGIIVPPKPKPSSA